ncbi:MAG: restriction endonuclease [Patescibacteria group bacterium]|nr:restriction endonuclease [Patescibacteria group bacterium]
MSSKQGDSFEVRIAHLLNIGGFQIKELQHRVIYDGQNIGDLDIVAEDPKTHAVIGVSCKEWLSGPPGSEQFSHFIEMLESENLKYGIFASATSIPPTIFARVPFVRDKKGINAVLLDRDKILQLEEWAHARQEWQIESDLRSGFGLETNKSATLGDIKQAQRTNLRGRTVECDGLLIPVNYQNEPPEYLINRNFTANHSDLVLRPFLVIEYNLHVEAREPRTQILLEERNMADIEAVDATSGQRAGHDNLIFDHIEKYRHHAESRQKIQETDFTVTIEEPRININEIIKIIKDDIVSQNEIRTTYTDANQQRRQIIVRPKPSDIRIPRTDIIYVPIWSVTFQFGNKSYKRTYFAYDGTTITDEMANCSICKNPTTAICTECYSTICEKHMEKCSVCDAILCENNAHICIECNNAFCSKDKPEHSCVVCKSVLCEKCDKTLCSECKHSVCSKHSKSCVECTNIVCETHVISKSFALVPKKFCNNECVRHYEEDYKSQGKFGKFKKILGK